MFYKSTRGKIQNLKFEDILLSGFLQDGGLAMPEYIPVLSENIMRSWFKLSYPELVEKIMQIYISEEEISRSKLKEIISIAYRKFDIPEVIQKHCLERNLYVAELFHGPTLSFKDLALSVVGQLLEYFSEKRQKHLNIVVATSGDTGSSAIESVRGLRWVDIVVLYPKGRCTLLQELQMTTVCDDNVTCIAIEKSSDELDIPIRECFADNEFSKLHNLCSINSINWARILIQIAHYFYFYFLIRPDFGKPVEFIVPTGGAGNITAGLIAKLMGLPIKLVSTVNRNDILYGLLKNGNMLKKEVFQTYAVAMDIQDPYNIERILHLIKFEDSNSISAWMEQFQNSGAITFDDKTIKALQNEWKVESIDDNAILQTIQFCWKKYQYLICPHTATAVAYCFRQNQDSLHRDVVQVCVATASPKKFPEAVTLAGVPCDLSLKEELVKQKTRYIELKSDTDLTEFLREIIERNSRIFSTKESQKWL